MTKRGRPRYPDILTPREWEVLDLLREGLTNDEIAQRLGVSLAGAKYHVSEILGKLGVENREEAAHWERGERPWWLSGVAPFSWAWRRLRVDATARAVGVATALAVAAGIALLAWSLARTSNEDGRRTIPLAAAVEDLVGCYRGTPSLPPSQSLLGATVLIGGAVTEDQAADKILGLMRDVEPIYFGVRGKPGTRIGEPGRLVETTIQIDIANDSLAFKYVRPGPVAPYGLLFDPTLINAWEGTDVLNPPGYAQLACAVPPEFDDLMAGLGFEGFEPVDVLESRQVPLEEAQRDIDIDRIEVWGEGQAHVVLPPLSDDQLMTEATEAPIEPEGDPLHVEIWYKGVDPFPEAVKPATYLYYPADASGLGLDILVQIDAARMHNGTLGRPGASFYPEPDLAVLVRDAVAD